MNPMSLNLKKSVSSMRLASSLLCLFGLVMIVLRCSEQSVWVGVDAHLDVLC